jgi:hypothetical protein
MQVIDHLDDENLPTVFIFLKEIYAEKLRGKNDDRRGQ